MNNKVKEVQEHLEKQGITVTETSIVNAAIEFLLQWGGTLSPEFWEKKRETKKEKGIAFDDIPVHIREHVFADIGHASMCWESPEGAGIFDTTQAGEIALELCQFICNLREGEVKVSKDPKQEVI